MSRPEGRHLMTIIHTIQSYMDTAGPYLGKGGTVSSSLPNPSPKTEKEKVKNRKIHE